MKEASEGPIRTPEGHLLNTPSWHHHFFPFQHLQPTKLVSTTCATREWQTYTRFYLILFYRDTLKIKIAVEPQVLEVEDVNRKWQYYDYNVEKYIISILFNKCCYLKELFNISSFLFCSYSANHILLVSVKIAMLTVVATMSASAKNSMKV